MGSSGRHSDNSSIDVSIFTNSDNINETIDPRKCAFFCDRGFMRSLLLGQARRRIIALLPCRSSKDYNEEEKNWDNIICNNIEQQHLEALIQELKEDYELFGKENKELKKSKWKIKQQKAINNNIGRLCTCCRYVYILLNFIKNAFMCVYLKCAHKSIRFYAHISQICT